MRVVSVSWCFCPCANHSSRTTDNIVSLCGASWVKECEFQAVQQWIFCWLHIGALIQNGGRVVNHRFPWSMLIGLSFLENQESACKSCKTAIIGALSKCYNIGNMLPYLNWLKKKKVETLPSHFHSLFVMIEVLQSKIWRDPKYIDSSTINPPGFSDRRHCSCPVLQRPWAGVP